MTRRAGSAVRDPAEVDAFLDAFFGEGNTIPFDRHSPIGIWLAPSLQALDTTSDVPVVLPRRRPDRPDRRIAYVIARDTRHAAEVAELLSAFVGPSYSYFDGRPARLDPGDPVERAVLAFAGGPGTAFTLFGPNTVSDQQIWRALRLLQSAVAMRPARLTSVRKPVGRLLAEFDAALAAGEHSASAAVLDQLAIEGGLSGTNLAHLRIKRLARLGRDAELLRLPELADVVLAGPPVPVIDDVLTALFSTALAGPVATGDLNAVRETVVERGSVVPALLDTDGTRLSSEAVTVLALAAWVRGDTRVLHRLLGNGLTRTRIGEIAPAVADELSRSLDQFETLEVANTALELADTPGPPARSHDGATNDVYQVDASRAPGTAPGEAESGVRGWADLVAAVAAGDRAARVALTEQRWRDWPAPVTADRDVAAVLGTLDDNGAEGAWSAVGAFIDADGYDHPATASAQEFVTNALSYGRFGPGDLAATVALTDIVLRGAPASTRYKALLDDLRAECSRWVAPERATVAMDLADQLVRHGCPDSEARLRLAIDLLGPLSAHAGRLDSDQIAFGRALSVDLALDLAWPAPADDDPTEDFLQRATENVLLYSLDEGVLARTSTALSDFAPGLKITLSSEKVGSPRLRQHARAADFVVLATRCATHAATGFIQANVRDDAVVAEADGSGSASLLRAAFACLRSRTAT
jgi:hypothetical protein